MAQTFSFYSGTYGCSYFIYFFSSLFCLISLLSYYFSSFGGSTAYILYTMNMTPMSCSLANGPEQQALQKPCLIAVISSLFTVLNSSSKAVIP